LPAVRHRVSGIDRDVDEARFELRNVDLDGPQCGRAGDFDLYRFPERALQKVAHAGEILVEVKKRGIERLAT
jgi:hypothetical protein